MNSQRLSQYVFSAVCLGILSAIASSAPPWVEDADAYLQSMVQQHDLAGLSAAVSVDNEIVWAGGAGFADLENQVPARANMVHRIASISKPQTAIAVMQLVEQGKVDLSDPLQKHIPEWPENEKGWTLRVENVLSHTSGIRHYKPNESGTMKHYPTLLSILDEFKDNRPAFEPGTEFKYTTYGYATLGVIIENVSGQSFEAYLREHVWEPANMMQTRLEWPGDIVPHRARGYSRDENGAIRNARYTDLSVKFPGGGILSTVEDLLRFVNAFDAGKLVKPETREKMLTPYTLADGKQTNYGFGWGLGTDPTLGRFYTHSGGQVGTSTFLIVFPDKRIAAAVFSNLDNTQAPGEVCIALARMASGLSPKP